MYVVPNWIATKIKEETIMYVREDVCIALKAQVDNFYRVRHDGSLEVCGLSCIASRPDLLVRASHMLISEIEDENVYLTGYVPVVKDRKIVDHLVVLGDDIANIWIYSHKHDDLSYCGCWGN